MQEIGANALPFYVNHPHFVELMETPDYFEVKLLSIFNNSNGDFTTITGKPTPQRTHYIVVYKTKSLY